MYYEINNFRKWWFLRADAKSYSFNPQVLELSWCLRLNNGMNVSIWPIMENFFISGVL